MDIKNIENKINSLGLKSIMLEDNEFSDVRILKSNSIDEFLDIVIRNDVRNIFYGFSTYDFRDFLVYDYQDSLSSKGIEKIKAYNNHVMSIDFSKPYKVTLFANIESVCIGVNFLDSWIDSEDVTDPRYLLDVVKEEDEELYYEEIEKSRKSMNSTMKDQKQKIMDFILNDPEFANKKNQESRYWYFHEVMETEEMKEYRDLLKPFGAPHIGNVKMFMDEVWRIHKERISKKEEQSL